MYRTWLAALLALSACAHPGSASQADEQLQAQIAWTKSELNMFRTALSLYYIDTSQYPTAEQGLGALLVAPAGIHGWKGPYLAAKDIPLDPWKRPFVYRFPGKIKSLGPDGIEGTADDIEETP